jgi:hypothetical protein
MTSKRATKQLSKALAVLMTLGSLFSISAVPAMADERNWDLDVYVTDSTPTDPCIDVPTTTDPATWTPDTSVSYTEGQTNDVYVDDGNVPFTVGLNFMTGTTYVCGQDPYSVAPSGSVVSSFTAISEDISGTTSCDTGCTAENNYLYDSSVISGTLSVFTSNAVGTRSGTLNVTWTPAD